jgi:hypothetical protein
MYTIELMFEWGGGTLWAANEAARSRYDVGALDDVLPLLEKTRGRLEELSVWHDTSLNWDYPPDPGPWSEEEYARFAAAAEEIRAGVQAELGADHAVVYDR